MCGYEANKRRKGKSNMLRIQYQEMFETLKQILLNKGFFEKIASRSAKLFTDNSRDGVYSHGLNRFPRVISYIDKGYIKINAVPSVTQTFGCLERWNGNLAMGNTNAESAMDRAIELAKENGIGVVTINNTNHWMRGGSYGWQAADAGMIGMCWTNTMPNMPAWGGKEPNIGNNPFVLAVPRSNQEHVVVDCSMAQFSYGKMEEYKLKGQQLPVAGGFDLAGNITKDPLEIEKSWRVLPIGFWKGSSLSIALDLIAAILSGGNSTTAVGTKCEDEYGISQVLIAINPVMCNTQEINTIIDEVLKSIKKSETVSSNHEILYPGERVIKTRSENLAQGIPVIEDIWASITQML